MASKTCDCGGCFEAVTAETTGSAAMCDECEDAGCSCDSTECQREDFGFDEDSLEGEDPHAVSRFLGFQLSPQT